MPLVYGKLTDFGLDPLTVDEPIITFRASSAAVAGINVLSARHAVDVKPKASGDFIADLVSTWTLAPSSTHYTVEISYRDPKLARRVSEILPWRLFVPAEGGPLGDLLRVASNPALVWTGGQPPLLPSPGTWWLDPATGDLSERSQDGTKWLIKTNLRGPAGYNATGAAEDMQAIAAYIRGTAGANPVAAALADTVGRELNTRREASVIVQGAKADYSGWLNVGGSGTGTDDRAAIQRALDAAVTTNGTGFWAYLSRRSVTVKLPAGSYLIGARADGQPSLQIPPGVTLDATDATLFFDYPVSPTTSWAGILVNRYANLMVGKIRPSGRRPAPDENPFYDGVRLWCTINNGTKVTGYKDSEIAGFQGAGARGVAAFVMHFAGIRFVNNQHAYVASNYGDGYGMPRPEGAINNVHTEVYFDDCQFISNKRGGFLGAVQGKAGSINTIDYDRSGVSVWFKSSSFEDMPGYAVHATNVFNLGLTDCHIEELGKDNGMIYLDTVRVLEIHNVMLNLAGREITGTDGQPTVARPSQILNVNSVQSLNVSGLYVHNETVQNFKLMSNAPRSYSTSGIMWDALPLAPGPGVTSHWGSTHLKADYIKPLLLGNTRLWVDTEGRLRTSTAAPTSATDGALVATNPSVNLGGVTHALGSDKTERLAAFTLGEPAPSWLQLSAAGRNAMPGPPVPGTATVRGHLPMRTANELSGNFARVATTPLPLAEYSAVMFEAIGLQWEAAATGDLNASAVIGLANPGGGLPAAGAEIRHNAWDGQACFMAGGPSTPTQGKYFPFNMIRAGAAAQKRTLAVLILPAQKIVVLLADGAVVNWQELPAMGLGLVQGRLDLINNDTVSRTLRVEALRLTTWK